MADRLHKVMAAAGVASRRKSEELIQEGRVRVNGEVITELGYKVEPGSDVIEVDGRRLKPQRQIVLAMNKPRGIITTMRDERGRKTVADLLPDLDVVVKPVGRLDKDTEGLLLFTNDGELAARLTHPSSGVAKVYKAIVKGKVSEANLRRLRSGLYIPREIGGRRKTSPARAELVHYNTRRDASTVELEIHEGAKRQVRLMFEAIGNPVIELKRTSIGPITLAKLPPGGCKMLSQHEIARLKKIIGL